MDLLRKTNRSSRRTFSDRCYSLLTRIPKGKVTTYKALANALGTSAYRAVGQAMGKNPNAPKVPCHRVIRSDGSLGGYSGGVYKKIALLQSEGVRTKSGKVVEFERKLFRFG